MERTPLAAIPLALILSLATVPATAEGEGVEPSSKSTDSERSREPMDPQVSSPPPDVLVYRPPARGKPRARIGGAVRGVDRTWPSLIALVPEHAGLTLSSQPSLFWYVDAVPEANVEVVFTLIEEGGIEPLLEQTLQPPAQAGIQRVDLDGFGLELEFGRAYQWSISLTVDPERPAQDIVTVGWIDRVEAPDDLTAGREAVSAGAYAQHGLWYDALTAAVDRAQGAPEDPESGAARDALLRQVGLSAVIAAK